MLPWNPLKFKLYIIMKKSSASACREDFALPYCTVLTKFWLLVNQRTCSCFSLDWKYSNTILTALSSRQVELIRRPLTIGYEVTMFNNIPTISCSTSIFVHNPDCRWLRLYIPTIKFSIITKPKVYFLGSC